MRNKWNFNIHIYFNQERENAWPTNIKTNPESEKARVLLGQVTKNVIDQIFKPEMTRTEAIKILSRSEFWLSKSPILVAAPKETKVFFEMIRLYILGKDIFDNTGKYQKWKAVDGISNLIWALQKETGTPIRIEVPELDKEKVEKLKNQQAETKKQNEIIEANDFKKKYPIEKFKDDIIKYSFDHPQLAKWGKVMDFLWKISHRWETVEEKAKLPAWIDKKLLPEHYAVVETLRHAMQDDMWGRNTGVFDQFSQRAKEFIRSDKKRTYEEYEKTIRASVNEAVKTKQMVLTVWWDKNSSGQNSYQTLSLEIVAKRAYNNPASLNSNAIKVLTETPWWEQRISEYLPAEGLLGLAMYFSGRNWNSDMLKTKDGKIDNEKVNFFTSILKNSNNKFETIKSESTESLYNDIPSLRKVMSLSEFRTMTKNGEIDIEQFAKKILGKDSGSNEQSSILDTPAIIMEFRTEFKEELKKAIQKNKMEQKEHREKIPNSATMQSSFPWIRTKIIEKSIKELTFDEVTIALTEIYTYNEEKRKKLKPGESLQVSDAQILIIKLLQNRQKEKAAVKSWAKIQAVTSSLDTAKTVAWVWLGESWYKNREQMIRKVEAVSTLAVLNADKENFVTVLKENTERMQILKDYKITPEALWADIWQSIKLYNELLHKKRTKWEEELFRTLEWIVSIKRQEAAAVAEIIKVSKNYDEARSYIAENTDMKAPSKHDLVKYEYIDKYFNTPAEERNYSQFEKTLVSIPPWERIAIKDIPSIDIWIQSEYIGNMNVCHNEWWNIGRYTLTDGRWIVVADNISLNAIPAIMNNVALLSTLGCEVLTPYMSLMSQHLWLVWNQSNSFDETFTYKEQVALIENLSIFLYGTKVTWNTIEEMIREFNSQNPNQVQPSNGVVSILRNQKNIITSNNTLKTNEFLKAMGGMRKEEAKKV